VIQTYPFLILIFYVIFLDLTNTTVAPSLTAELLPLCTRKLNQFFLIKDILCKYIFGLRFCFVFMQELLPRVKL